MVSAFGYGTRGTGDRDAVAAEVARRGWEPAGWSSDPDDAGPGLERPGLARALAAISDGPAERLVVARLDAVTRRLPDLARLLDWLEGAGAALVSLEPALDTSTRGGRDAAALVMALESWQREDRARRPHPKGPPGRPAVAHDRALSERIRAMRAEGLSLRAIAAELNREGVPTLRGGAEWRASSVQAAAGYRRPPKPHPPAPGLPPHPPRGPGHRPRKRP